MKKLFFLPFLLVTLCAFGQLESVKPGDRVPDVNISHIINAITDHTSIGEQTQKKILILNFWGTWCSPCIPEMDKLAQLQKANANDVQIIAISNDAPERLQKYLTKKPTTVWLATDTSYFLYKLFSLASVGNSAIVGPGNRLIALMNTDSITQRLIDNVMKHAPIKSNAYLNEVLLNTGADPFGVDSLTSNSFTIRGYMSGKHGMSMTPNSGPYAYRRVTFLNTCASEIFRRANNLHTPKQIRFEINEKEVCDYDDHQTLYCLDILVKPEEKDSLISILKAKLVTALPFRTKIEYIVMPVYLLKLKQKGKVNIPISHAAKSSYGFSGNGYDGTAVRVSAFADDYLTNELDAPVIDETGLTDRYDIKTVNELRTSENTIKAVEKLGMVLEKSKRKIKRLVIYR